ncbi:MAG: single-stranded DNA-specific DHH superfamily exonuclease, partial [Halieaceae bacterium]
MTAYDVFNGDADGICALLQLRLAEPREAVLITGVKRDIQLLDKLDPAQASTVTVLDVSLDKNREPLEALLAAGVPVFYCDHHFAGEIPASEHLDAHINTAPNVCTSLLINGHLGGAHAHWAVVGAFGDNLQESALAAARAAHLDAATIDLYRRLGTYINYNGYGAAIEDLHFPPADIYRLMLPFAEPRQFVADAAAVFQQLESGYQDDMARAESLQPVWSQDCAAVFTLPE